MSARKRDQRTYFSVSNGYVNSPKIAKAGGDAGWLDLCALDYCSSNMTDGLVPKTLVPRLSDRTDPLALASRLLAVGRWHEDGHDCDTCPQPGADDYVIHDYLEHQRSRVEIEAQREVRKAAGQRGGQAKAANAAKREALANAVASATANAKQTASKSLPESESESESEKRTAAAASAAVAKRGTRLPEDWVPDERLKAWVRKTCTNLTSDEMASHTRQFKRFWLSKTGRDATKLDWSMTYQNWMEQENGKRAARSINGRPAAAAATPGKVQITQ